MCGAVGALSPSERSETQKACKFLLALQALAVDHSGAVRGVNLLKSHSFSEL